MKIHAWVDKYFDHAIDIGVQAAIHSSVFIFPFWFSLWCVDYVGMDDNWFLLALRVGATISIIAFIFSVFALTLCVIVASFTGWILTFGGVFFSILVLELIQIYPKVHDRINGNIDPSLGDLPSIIVLLAPVVLLAVAFLSTRNHEKELARLRNIPLTSKYEWSQDDG